MTIPARWLRVDWRGMFQRNSNFIHVSNERDEINR